VTTVKLSERINQGPFFLDGAMGTQLFARGVEVGRCNDYLNIESPDIVFDIHTAYLQAGSDAVITNTFSANKYALARHSLAEKVAEINRGGAQIGRKAAGDDKYVLGDIGPCGDFLEPLGNVKPDELRAAFADQAKALAAGGVDGFIIETMTAIEEIIVAIEGIKSVSDLPIFASLAYDPAGEGFKTMMGVGPETVVAKLTLLQITAIGFNCGTLDMAGYVKLAAACASAIGDKPIVLLAEPNAGKPELVDGKAVYNLSPEDFAAACDEIHTAGANIIGGCCGTSPAHIEALAPKLKNK
jgi:5-methyltetrahydrofolate--homocysteine methyltransferase